MPLLSNDGRCRRIMAFFVESSERHESQRNKKAKACSFKLHALAFICYGFGCSTFLIESGIP